jgi:thioredoxin-dependent peroxiredoxin
MRLGLLSLLSLLPGCVHGRALNAGDVAPEFALRGSDGRTYRLGDYRNREVVVLAWFPKANTSG